jgi:hypothetical protein
MSSLYGPIRQLGYVVKDLEASAIYWANVLGVGPFFRIDNIVYKGLKYKNGLIDIDVSVALAYSGDLQIELVQQNNSVSSIYSDFMEKHGEGLQHIAVWPNEFDKNIDMIQQAGGELLMEGEAGGGTRFAYFGGLVHAGAVLEVVTQTSGAMKLYKMMKDASENWDGTMPVRSFSAEKWSAKSPT